MKNIQKKLLTIFSILTVALTFGSGAFAGYDGKYTEVQRQEHIQAMRNAASALSTSNPDLSKDLTTMADLKENRKQMKMENKMQDHHKHNTIMRDAAAALKSSNPDLSTILSNMIDTHKYKTKMEGLMGNEDMMQK